MITSRKSAPVSPAESRPSAASGPRSKRPAGPGSTARENRPRRKRHRQDDRQLNEEDRLPAQELGEQAAGGGADREADDSRRSPHGRRVAVGAARAREQLDRGGDHRRAAERLHAARCDQNADRGRHGADERCAREQHETRRPDPWSHAPREPRGGQDRERQHQVERRQDPRDAEHGRIELPQDVGQRQRHDRRVGEHEPDHHRPHALPYALGVLIAALRPVYTPFRRSSGSSPRRQPPKRRLTSPSPPAGPRRSSAGRRRRAPAAGPAR